MSIRSEAIIIRDETTVGANTASRVGGNLLQIADDLIAKQNEIDANNSKVGITTQQAADIADNNSKVGITTQQAADITANNSKTITINSVTTGEPTGSDAVLNVVSLTQAEYDAGAKVATTFYIITN